MNVIETKNLKKIYSQGEIKVNALNDVSVNFKQGEFTAVVGPSGSGKTTFLNTVGGLDKPTSGNVMIDNLDITKLKANKIIDFRLRNIGFVFQSYNLIPVLTAKENIEFIMLMQGYSEANRNERALELLDAVGLSKEAKRRPGQLSGGQQQRVAVARALINSPSILLADEPTGNLDSKNAEKIQKLFKKINSELNVTIVLVTHNKAFSKIADKCLVLSDGKWSK